MEYHGREKKEEKTVETKLRESEVVQGEYKTTRGLQDQGLGECDGYLGYSEE